MNTGLLDLALSLPYPPVLHCARLGASRRFRPRAHGASGAKIQREICVQTDLRGEEDGEGECTLLTPSSRIIDIVPPSAIERGDVARLGIVFFPSPVGYEGWVEAS